MKRGGYEYPARYELRTDFRNSIISILEEQVKELENQKNDIDDEYVEMNGITYSNGREDLLDEQISNLKEIIKELRK